jgi:hypothetical protein
MPQGLHGASTSVATLIALNFLKPCTTAVPIATRSAQVPTGYEAFSTLAPLIKRPSTVRRVAPTRNWLYGQYAALFASTARRCSSSKSFLLSPKALQVSSTAALLLLSKIWGDVIVRSEGGRGGQGEGRFSFSGSLEQIVVTGVPGFGDGDDVMSRLKPKLVCARRSASASELRASRNCAELPSRGLQKKGNARHAGPSLPSPDPVARSVIGPATWEACC